MQGWQVRQRKYRRCEWSAAIVSVFMRPVLGIRISYPFSSVILLGAGCLCTWPYPATDRNYPPQHGKSEGTTRLLPSYVLGLDPDLRIAVASYSDTFARKFNRAIQRIIDSPEYYVLFPETLLNGNPNCEDSAQYVRNNTEFEIVGRKGFLKAVGRNGALTGERIDLAILDDLYKNALEGNSPIIRESVVEWYKSTVKTRLHNNSRELMVFTRWHEEDLIGTIIAAEDVRELRSLDDIDAEFDGWYYLNFEAIKESDPTPLDPGSVARLFGRQLMTGNTCWRNVTSTASCSSVCIRATRCRKRGYYTGRISKPTLNFRHKATFSTMPITQTRPIRVMTIYARSATSGRGMAIAM